MFFPFVVCSILFCFAKKRLHCGLTYRKHGLLCPTAFQLREVSPEFEFMGSSTNAHDHRSGFLAELRTAYESFGTIYFLHTVFSFFKPLVIIEDGTRGLKKYSLKIIKSKLAVF